MSCSNHAQSVCKVSFTRYSQNSGYGGYRQQYGSEQFADIRRLLSMGRILEAEELLNGIPALKRDAEWHYLKGSVLYSRGFLEDSLDYFSTATRLDSNNIEYRNTLNTIMRQRQFGYGNAGHQFSSSCSTCNFCAALCCANFACNSLRCCC